VSRITHKNADVWTVLRNIYTAVIQEHPQQALWMFASTIKSTDPERSKRGNKILSRVQVRAVCQGRVQHVSADEIF
jgi:serine/threonine-protein kinase ATR